MGVVDLERVQAELQQREREILELAYVRRADSIERIRDAVRRLGELGSPAGILARAAHELGTASQFDRVLISEVADGRMRPRALWERESTDAPKLDFEVALDYPLIEHDVVRNRRAQLVDTDQDGPRTPRALRETLRPDGYVVAPIVAEGHVIGLLHADATASGRTLDDVDREVATIACTGLGEVFDRAVLRETLQRHRAELQSAVGWITGRLRAMAAEPGTAAQLAGGDGEIAVDSLTPREREILALMARGQTNAAIAEALVVREGTVKYHVKNVLRKLGARSRADAVARYARATGTAPR